MHDNDKGCMTTYDERCPLHEYATFHGFIGLRVLLTVVSICSIVLALTSEWAQYFLGSAPM